MAEIPFPDESFDCVTISFGIRNASDVPLCLREIHRVLKKGGRLLILEGSIPSNRIIQAFHLIYLRHMLPRIGSWISKNKDAYVYLNQTIETFPCGSAFCKLLTEAGYSSATFTPLTFGAVTIYQGDKS
jgi:demethylmenaquinone methyltransferase/2-methoxy-6-polyprenyl-1,4-benzoquinol methylase